MKRLIVISLITMITLTARIAAKEPVVQGIPADPFTQEQIEMYEALVEYIKDDEAAMIIERKAPEYIILEEIPFSEDLQKWCQDKCRQYNVSYSFFLAMCETESSLGQDVGSGENVKGYMQIARCNWNRYPELDVNDTYDNCEIGIRMLGEQIEEYCSTDMIIMGYKAGENRMLEMVAHRERLGVCDTVAERANYWEQELRQAR